ncbi:MAG: hypothetical protein V4477_16830 [Pseudomonadota bacterium]
MDRLTAFVAIAHLKLRLQILVRHPEFLEGIDMTPKLAGLASSLATLRHSLEGQAADLMSRADAVNARIATAMTKAKAQMAVTEQAATDIEEFANSLEGANGGPSLSDSSGTSGQSQEPERLSVNGVAQG